MSTSIYEDASTWRLRTPGGVPYRIVDSTGSFEKESASVTGIYLIRAVDLAAFVVEAFPAPVVFGAVAYYPSSPTFPGTTLYVKKVSWKSHVGGKPVDPFNQDPTAPEKTYHPVLEVTVEYGPQKDQDEDSDPNDPQSFLKISGRAAGEYLHAPVDQAQWSDGTADSSSTEGTKEPVRNPNIPSTIIVPETEWTVTWERIPRFLFTNKLISKMRSLLGKVNSKKMALLHDAPKETILFLGYDFDEEFTWRTLNQPPVSLSLKFLEKNVLDYAGKQRGHNDFWKPGVGWQRLLLDVDTGQTAHQSGDLNSIWSP